MLAILAFAVLIVAMPTSDRILSVHRGGGTIDVSVGPGDLTASSAELSAWVDAAVESVTRYYGRFPIAHTELRIKLFDGDGVYNGHTFERDNSGLIRIAVGSKTTVDQLRADWMLTHEIVHLAFPSVAENNHWIEEGIATYVEPIARLQAGFLKPEKVWGDLSRDVPQGLPREGDQGLDRTHTWARTYWGGALFCLVADVKIRQQTRNEKGLQDALRGILNAGGNIAQEWDLERALRIGDQATGTHVLQELYRRMKDEPVSVDLDSLWRQLGVEMRNGTITFNETAPWASVRRSIDAGKAQP
jgi:hypothetical protein